MGLFKKVKKAVLFDELADECDERARSMFYRGKHKPARKWKRNGRVAREYAKKLKK